MLQPTACVRARCEAIKAAGVVPFLWSAARGGRGDARAIAAAVVANGVLCHLSSAARSPCEGAWRAVDVACNVLFVTYVNVRTAWPGTAPLTLFACVAWRLSGASATLAGAAVHVVCVQWALLWCLAEFQQ